MFRTLLHTAFVLCTATCAASAQSILARFWGSSANLHVGASMDEIGDINNDNYHDMLVGAPNPGGVGAVYFVSGKYLATGSGFATLGSTFAPVSGDLFGSCVLGIGDVTGDGVGDVLVGEPGSGAPNTGWVHLISGASKAIVNGMYLPNSTFGTSMSRCGDVDGDGYTDVIIGSPSSSAGGGSINVVSPRKLFLGTNFVLKVVNGGPTGFGCAVSAGDIDNDGYDEYVVGSSIESRIYVFEQTGPPTPSRIVAHIFGTDFGAALDASRDFDGDGHDDILVGAPLADTVWLLSGSRITASGGVQSPGVVEMEHWNGQIGSHFGHALTTTPDTNADFVPDIVIGAPLYDSTFPVSTDRGAVHFISGDTRSQIGLALGSIGEQLGTSVSRAWDYDGDIRFDIAAGAPLSDYGANNGGIMRIYSLFPAAPASYCVGKLNSLGCTPAIGYNGALPSLTSPLAFNVTATNLINNKPGLLLYGYYPANAPFQGGTLCVQSPLKRVGAQSTLGNPPPNDCSGKLTYDFNARIQSGLDTGLNLHGQEVFCQYWSRDPTGVNGSSLSNALRFVINP